MHYSYLDATETFIEFISTSLKNIVRISKMELEYKIDTMW